MNSKPWDGREERRSMPTDHDTLIRMVAIVEAHVKNFEKHVEDDRNDFKALNRSMWIGIGILTGIQWIPSVFNLVSTISQAGGK